MPLATVAAVRHPRSRRVISALVTGAAMVAADCGGKVLAPGPMAPEKPDIVIGTPLAVSSAALFIAGRRSVPEDGILALPDSGITAAEQLRGKIIGVPSLAAWTPDAPVPRAWPTVPGHRADRLRGPPEKASSCCSYTSHAPFC
jgi:ABC-type nitrate/sulfonate/bicarbonate transport system substrate-binding protein